MNSESTREIVRRIEKREGNRRMSERLLAELTGGQGYSVPPPQPVPELVVPGREGGRWVGVWADAWGDAR